MPADQPEEQRKAWDYMTLQRPHYDMEPISEAELKTLGQEGWEMCGGYTKSVPAGAMFTTFYFKRPL